MIIPLLGITYLITITGPSASDNMAAYLVFIHVRAFLLSIQVKIDTPIFHNNKLLTYFPPFKPGLRCDAALLLPEHGDPKRGSVSLGALPDNQVGKTG